MSLTPNTPLDAPQQVVVPNVTKWTHLYTYISLILFTLLGLGLSQYLYMTHNNKTLGGGGDSSVCHIGEIFDCDKVASSSFSTIFGIPIAASGIFFFTTILFLLFFFRPQHAYFLGGLKVICILTSIGLLIDIYLFLLQAFVIRSFCLFCMGTYAASTYIFGISMKLLVPSFLGKAPKISFPPLKNLWAVFFLSILFSTLFVFVPPGSFFNSLIFHPSRDTLSDEDKELFTYWTDALKLPIPTSNMDPMQGNPKAPIEIVIFSDFECPHCLHAGHILSEKVKNIPEIKVFYKNFPLDMSCNKALVQSMHKNSCALSYLGACLQREHKFWDFEKKVFSSSSFQTELMAASEEKLQSYFSDFFSQQAFKSCLKDPSIHEKINNDIALGLSLHIGETPSVFINGKKFPLSFNEDNFDKFIGWEISFLKK